MWVFGVGVFWGFWGFGGDRVRLVASGWAVGRAVGAENVGIVPPETGAEDFSFFAQEVPSFYFKLGAVASGNTSGGHHTPTFRADDEAIPVGVRAMTAVVLEALAKDR